MLEIWFLTQHFECSCPVEVLLRLYQKDTDKGINLGMSTTFTMVSCWYLCHHWFQHIDCHWSQAISFFNCRERGKKINSNFSLQSLIEELTSVKSTSFSISPKELKAGTQSGTGLSMTASFTIAKRWQQPACALTGDWTELMRCLPQGDRIQSCRKRECRPVLQHA